MPLMVVLSVFGVCLCLYGIFYAVKGINKGISLAIQKYKVKKEMTINSEQNSENSKVEQSTQVDNKKTE